LEKVVFFLDGSVVLFYSRHGSLLSAMSLSTSRGPTWGLLIAREGLMREEEIYGFIQAGLLQGRLDVTLDGRLNWD
jgi:hypothetical protein